MSKILVTGAKGFLGAALTRRLSQMGHQVTALERQTCDLAHPHSIEHLSSYPADFIFHLAGKIGVMASWQNPADFYRHNVDSTRHVLEVARIKQIPPPLRQRLRVWQTREAADRRRGCLRPL